MLLIFLLSLNGIIISSSTRDNIFLNRIDTFPKVHHNIFFRVAPIISVDEYGSIYASDNRDNSVYKIDIARNEALTIARGGQGPGELQRPFGLTVEGDNLIVLDNTGVHLYDTKGKFINRFKAFNSSISIAADSENVYLAQTGDKDLIHVFSHRGQRKRSFGNKYISNAYLTKEFSSSFVESIINNGKILVGKKYIYYISNVYSEIFKYDLSGNLLERAVVAEDELLSETREHYNNKEKVISDNQEFITRETIIDSCYFKGNIYIFRRYRDGNKINVYILKISEDNLQSVKNMYFKPDERMENNYWNSMCVGGSNSIYPDIYISVRDKESGEAKIYVFKEGR